MKRILVIDQDRSAMERIGLGCLEREVGVVMAETVCEGVRVLLGTPVSSIVVDQRLLRLSPREHGTLFDRVAPGVPVVVVVGPETPLDVRVGHELVGFRVVARPVVVEDLLEKTPAEAVGGGPVVKWLLTAVVAVLVLVSVAKLSCVASERWAAAAPIAESLFTDALEPELPIASEVGQVDPTVTPTLTR